MDTIRKATSPDEIPGYDKAYWHAKTPLERLDTAQALGTAGVSLPKPDEIGSVHKFSGAADWQAFKREHRQKGNIT